MDIEEEVEEIDQEIKKPIPKKETGIMNYEYLFDIPAIKEKPKKKKKGKDEGQVAEREWNYRRHPEAEDIDAPDVFANFRKETLPIFETRRKFSNPFKRGKKGKKIGNITWEDDVKTIADHIKEQKEMETLAQKHPNFSEQEKHEMDHPDTSEYSFYKSVVDFYTEIKKLDPDKPYDPDEEEKEEAGKYSGAKPASRESGLGSGVFPSKWKPRRLRGRESSEHPTDAVKPMTSRKEKPSGVFSSATLPKGKKKKKPKVAQTFQTGRRQAINQAMTRLVKDIFDPEQKKRIKDKPELIPAKDSGKKTPKPKRVDVKDVGGKLTGDKVETASPKTGKNAKRLMSLPKGYRNMPFWAQKILFNLASDQGKPSMVNTQSSKIDPKTGKSKYKPKKRNIAGKMPRSYHKPSKEGKDWQGKVKALWVDVLAI